MKLYFSNTSPYSRKVRLCIIHKGLQEQVEEVPVDPFSDDPVLNRVNPLGRLPALILENNESLFDSPVICRYLDTLTTKSSLIPQTGWSQWQTLCWEALADGVTDATYNLVMERRRPAAEQSPGWIANWSTEIQAGLRDMEHKVDKLQSEITLAHLAVGSAIGYLDFRIPELLYSSECPQVSEYPQLVTWYERFKTHTSMIATSPV